VPHINLDYTFLHPNLLISFQIVFSHLKCLTLLYSRILHIGYRVLNATEI